MRYMTAVTFFICLGGYVYLNLRVTEKINYPILFVSRLGNVVASMAQYGQHGTFDATTLPNRYPTQFLYIYYFPRP